jgi:3-oxoacyl-[acyl-carrier protein] reductase
MSKRRALITGASKGIGREVADRLVAGDFEVIGVARTAPSDFPGQFYAVDLSDRGATTDMLIEIVAGGPVDAVVNNVSLQRFGYIGSIDLDDLFVTYDMNVRVAVQVVQAVLPGMIEGGWGRIVNVSSLVTLGVAERTPYAAAKAALETCTRIWARELASHGITVNAVAPGPYGIRSRSACPQRHPAAAGRHSCRGGTSDRHVARRRRRIHDRTDRQGRRRWQYQRSLKPFATAYVATTIMQSTTRHCPISAHMVVRWRGVTPSRETLRRARPAMWRRATGVACSTVRSGSFGRCRMQAGTTRSANWRGSPGSRGRRYIGSWLNYALSVPWSVHVITMSWHSR